MAIRIKRIYEKPSRQDGERVLVDGLWPRGISKEEAKINLWLKDAAPSASLRTWLHADPRRNYREFSRKYAQELEERRYLINKSLGTTKGDLTLVTAVKDIGHSHIPILASFLSEKGGKFIADKIYETKKTHARRKTGH